MKATPLVDIVKTLLLRVRGLELSEVVVVEIVEGGVDIVLLKKEAEVMDCHLKGRHRDDFWCLYDYVRFSSTCFKIVGHLYIGRRVRS